MVVRGEVVNDATSLLTSVPYGTSNVTELPEIVPVTFNELNPKEVNSFCELGADVETVTVYCFVEPFSAVTTYVNWFEKLL